MSNKPLQLVVFTLDDQCYGLKLSTVERAVRMVEITALPKAPEIVLGVINVCGDIIPVLNIRRRFGLPERELALSDHLLIVRTATRTAALVADMVCDVIGIEEDAETGAEEIVPGMQYVEGVVKLPDGMIFIHDVDTFLSLEEEQALTTAIRESD